MLAYVSHPVPIVHFPRRGRKARVTFAADTTPVELSEADPAEMEPLQWDGGHERHAAMFHLHDPGLIRKRDGEAWLRMVEPGGEFTTPGKLVSLLAGEAQDATASVFRVKHARTPLVAHVIVGGPSHTKLIDGYECGAAFDESGQSRILADGRGKSGAEVAAYVHENFLVAGDAAYVRYRPAAAPSVIRMDPRPRFETLPVLMTGRLPSINPWQVERAETAWGQAAEDLDAFLAARKALPDRSGCVDDILRIANWAAVRTRSHVTAASGMFERKPTDAVRDALDATVAALAPYEIRGAVGGIGEDDAMSVLGLAADAFDLHAKTVMRGAYFLGMTGRFRTYVEGYAADAMARHAVDEADVQAFHGI